MSKLIPTIPSIPPNDCAIINSELLLINHNNCHPANDSSFFRPPFDCGINPPNDDSANSLTCVEQAQVYSIYYSSSLILPSNWRGERDC